MPRHLITSKAVTMVYTDISEKNISLTIEDIYANSLDGHSTILFKMPKLALAKSTQIIPQSFLESYRLRTKLKEEICPIPKGGSRVDINSYRTISLTSLISKVMEKIFRNKIIAFLEDYLLSDI